MTKVTSDIRSSSPHNMMIKVEMYHSHKRSSNKKRNPSPMCSFRSQSWWYIDLVNTQRFLFETYPPIQWKPIIIVTPGRNKISIRDVSPCALHLGQSKGEIPVPQVESKWIRLPFLQGSLQKPTQALKYSKREMGPSKSP